MNERLSRFLTQLDDPAQYVRVPGVAIFDAHVDEYYVDAKGKPCKKTDKGARKVVHKFDRKRLEQIAANCNKRTNGGTFAPLSIGHTDPDEPDERKQPVSVGVARNYAVGFDKTLGRDVLRADYYIRKEDYPTASTFPRTSVELWPATDPREEIVDPISLLRRCPQRDLGQWAYSKSKSESKWADRRGRTVLRYSMEFSPMANSRATSRRYAATAPPAFADDPATLNDESLDDPTTIPDESLSEDALADPEAAEQFLRHVFSHPAAQKMCAKYAAEVPNDPTLPPDIEGEPVMNAASAAGATNGTLPLDDPAAKPYGRNGVARKYGRQGDPILHKRIQELEAREASRVADNWVLSLEQDGWEMDDEDHAELVRRYQRGGDKECEQYAKRIANTRRQRIDAPHGRVPLAPSAVRGGRPGEPDAAHHARARQYAREHAVKNYNEALEATKDN